MFFEHLGNIGCRVVPILLAVLQLLITCPSCSVKEDRDACPCRLELEFSGEDAARCRDGIILTLRGVSGAADGFVLRDTLLDETAEDRVVWTSDVPKGQMVIAAVWPDDIRLEQDIRTGKMVNIQAGKDSPMLWSCCKEVLLEKESVRHTMTLSKNYCHLALRVEDTSGATFPFRMEVRGNVCGYNLDGTLQSGKFVAEVKYLSDADGNAAAGMAAGMAADMAADALSSSRNIGIEAYINLPRQKDNSLCLDIISEDDKVRTFALGNYIEDSGYDWSSENLKDITMTIDYARTSIGFRIGAWERYEHFEVVI